MFELFNSLCIRLSNDTGNNNAFLLIISWRFSSLAINLNSYNMKLWLNISNNLSSVNIYSFFALFSNSLYLSCINIALNK